MRKQGNLAVKINKTAEKRDQIVRETIVKNAMTMGSVMYARIPLHLLDKPAWQRTPNMSNVRKIATGWDEPKAQAIIVSYRDGRFWIIDGQHRILAARMRGLEDIFSQIYVGLSVTEEVALFKEQNDYKTVVRSYNKVFAENQIGENPGKDIFDVLRENNVRHVDAKYAGTGVLTCMATVEAAYKHSGREGIDWVFKTIKALQWSEAKGGYSSKVIDALAKVYRKFSETLNMEEVAQKIVRLYGRYAPDDVVLQAQNTYKGYGPCRALATLFEAAVN